MFKGRWTTYHFVLGKEPSLFGTIIDALEDYNIEVVHLPSFKTAPGPSAAEINHIWSLLDPPKSDKIEAETAVPQSAALGNKVLPFEVRYQLEVCISHGIIKENNITSKFINALANLASTDPAKATQILEYAMGRGQRIFDPMSILSDKEALTYSSTSKIPHYCAFSRKATITPTTIYYSSPTVETTNRVIRQYTELYGDRFLRVQFTDEKFEVGRDSK